MMAGPWRSNLLLPLLFGMAALATQLSTPTPAQAQDTYRVVGVAEGDWLNVRAGPSADFPVVGTLQGDAGGIRQTGECEERWCPIRRDGLRGWVNSRFLAAEAAEPAISEAAESAVAETAEASAAGATHAVLSDGTIELRFPNGSARRSLPDGNEVNVLSDGTVLGSMRMQTQSADLPSPPPGAGSWEGQVSGKLLSILANILTPAELAAFRGAEAGKSQHQIMNWRLRSIVFLTKPRS